MTILSLASLFASLSAQSAWQYRAKESSTSIGQSINGGLITNINKRNASILIGANQMIIKIKDQVVIINLKKHLITVIDHKKHEYATHAWHKVNPSMLFPADLYPAPIRAGKSVTYQRIHKKTVAITLENKSENFGMESIHGTAAYHTAIIQRMRSKFQEDQCTITDFWNSHDFRPDPWPPFLHAISTTDLNTYWLTILPSIPTSGIPGVILLPGSTPNAGFPIQIKQTMLESNPLQKTASIRVHSSLLSRCGYDGNKIIDEATYDNIINYHFQHITPSESTFKIPDGYRQVPIDKFEQTIF